MTVVGVRLSIAAVFLSSFPVAALNPVAHWAFEDTGPSVEDSTGNGLNGNAPGCLRAKGHAGQAIQLDGEHGMSVAASPLLRGKDGFTVQCRIWSDVPAGPLMNILSKPGEWMLRVDPATAGGTISFYVWCDESGWEPRARGPRLREGKWHHIIASWDGRTARLAVDGQRFASAKAGECPSTESPLLIGTPTDSLGGFRGRIDDVRVYNLPVGPIGLAKMALELQDADGGPPVRDPDFDFAEGADGWYGKGNAICLAQDGRLQVELPEQNSLALVDGLDANTTVYRFCELRMTAHAGRRVILTAIGSHAFVEVPVRLAPDGRRHTVSIPLAEGRWEGTIQALALAADSSGPVHISIDRIRLTRACTAPPDVRILALSPERRVNSLQESLNVICWVENGGGPARDVRLSLTAGDGRIHIEGNPLRIIDDLPHGTRRTVTWRINSPEPLRGNVAASVDCAGERVASRMCDVSFSRTPQEDTITLHRSRAWLRAGYPRSMDFRHLHPGSIGLLQHNTALLVDMQQGRIEAAREFKQRYPDRLVLMQVNDEPNGIWGSWHVVPREFAVKQGLQFDPDIFPMPRFRGYWLLGRRVPLTTGFPGDAETCDLTVPDVADFATHVWGHRVLRDVLVYPVSDGSADWTRAEFASVVVADADTQSVRLKRWPREAVGEWHAFRADEAFLAPSAGSVYRLGNGPWIKTWIPNLTPFCPRDPETGLDAVTWWARHFAKLWHTRVAPSEPHPDGIEFDGLDEGRLGDCNQDGVLDACLIDGVNQWHRGRGEFLRKLREGDGFEGLGDTLIMADANNTWSLQTPGLVNGYESEEFPSFGGPRYFPEALDMYRLWCAKSAKPVCCYLQGRFGCDTYRERPWRQLADAGKFHGDHLVRLGIGSACMGTGFYTFRTGSKRDTSAIFDEELVEYPWDEFHAGTEGVYNWLGNPLGPPVRLTDHLGDDLLASADGRWEDQTFADNVQLDAAVTEPRDGTLQASVHVHGQGGPRGPAAGKRAVLLSPPLPVPLETGEQYTVSFTAEATAADRDISHGKLYSLGVRLRTDTGAGTEQWFLTGPDARDVTLTLVAPVAARSCRVAFLVGAEPCDIRVADMSLRKGCAEIFTRRFEGGLVLLNGSARTPHTFDLGPLGESAPFRHFHGAQAPDTNNGAPVGRTVIVPPSDALLLRRVSE